MEVDGDAITSLLLKMFRDLHRPHVILGELRRGESLICHIQRHTQYPRAADTVDHGRVTCRHLL